MKGREAILAMALVRAANSTKTRDKGTASIRMKGREAVPTPAPVQVANSTRTRDKATASTQMKGKAQVLTPSADRVAISILAVDLAQVRVAPAETTISHSGVALRLEGAMSTSPAAAVRFGCAPMAG